MSQANATGQKADRKWVITSGTAIERGGKIRRSAMAENQYCFRPSLDDRNYRSGILQRADRSMRRILIIAATISIMAQNVAAAQSGRGPNFPSSQHGRAYPKTMPDQRPSPSAAGPPAPEQRNIELQSQPGMPSFPSGREQPALASRWTPGSSDINGWNALLLGPGEQVTSNDIQCDQGLEQCNASGSVTKVARTDTYDAWYRNTGSNGSPYCGAPYVGQPTNGCWINLIRPDNMPVGAATGSGLYQGVVEIQVAPSNTNVAYMIWASDGCLYYTNNLSGVAKGTARWTKPTQPSGACLPGAGPNNYESNTGGSGSKFFHPMLAIDPHDPGTVLVSTPGIHGSYYSTNSGGAWSPLTTIGTASAAGDGNGGGAVFAFDRTSWSRGDTLGIYACVYGNGVWHTSRGVAGTWSRVSGTSGTMPTKCREMIVDPAGVLWVADDNNTVFQCSTCGPWSNVNTYTPGTTTWLRLSSLKTGQAYFIGIAIDYNTNCSGSESTCHLCMANQAGDVFCSTTGNTGSGSGFSESPADNSSNFTITANDIPWYTNFVNFSPGNLIFDPSVSNTLDMPQGYNYAQVSLTGFPATYLPFTSYGAGIRQFNVFRVMDENGIPILSMYDHAVAVMQGGPSIYPNTLCTGYNCQVNQGDDLSRVPGYPNDAVLVASYNSIENGFWNGSSWSPFAYQPPLMNVNGTSRQNLVASGGNIAASSPTHWLWVGKDGGDLYVTTNGATSPWTFTCPGEGTGVACGLLAQTSSSGTGATLTIIGGIPSYLQTGFTKGYTYQLLDATSCPNTYPPPSVTAISSTQVTVTAVPCAIKANDYIWIRPTDNWIGAPYNFAHRLAADDAGNGTYYALYDGQGTPGIWVTQNDGSSWALGFGTQLSGGNNGRTAWIKATPSHSLNFYAGEGYNTVSFYECESAGTGLVNSITCTAIAKGNTSPFGGVPTWTHTITYVADFCFGKNKSGSYPSVYFFGAVDGVFGFYQTNDHFQTFTNLNAINGIKPMTRATGQTLDYPSDCAGDMTKYGTVIWGFGNSDGFYVTGLP